jgi:hypothetical protein
MVIYQAVVQRRGTKATVYSPRTWHLRVAKFPAQSKDTPEDAGTVQTDSVKAPTLRVLTDSPCPSVLALSRLTCLSRSTIYRCLTESFGLTIRHLHWISYPLPDDQKGVKVNPSQELLRVLQRQ